SGRLVDHPLSRVGASRVACAFLVYMLPPLPRCSSWAYSSLISPGRISLPRKGCRVGLRIVLFEIPWRVGGSDRFPGKVKGLLPPILELTMNITTDQPEAPTAIRTDLGAIFVSLELSRASWLITSLSAGRWREDVEACGAWGRCEPVAGALFAAQGEGAGTDGEGLPADRHPGSWARWLLDRSGAAK